jgi:hypothetical protein
MMLRLPRAMIVTIDSYRRLLDDLPSRPEVIRRLIAEASTNRRLLKGRGDPEGAN